jgi:hypothetical protein
MFSKIIKKQAIIFPAKIGYKLLCVRYSLLKLIDKVCINVIYKDIDGFHNHPWDFVSIVLWGGYKETIWDNGKQTINIYKPGSIIKRKHTEFHKLEPLGKKAITLFFKGKKQKEHIQFVKNNKVYHEAKFFMMQGYPKEKLKFMYEQMHNFTERKTVGE